MIIAASRIATASGAGAVGSHVFTGPKNESIELVRGARADLDDMVSDAREHDAKYAIRHYKIAPAQATTRGQALGIVAALGQEFGFDPERAVVVEHEKPRAGGKGFDRHWHAMVPEVDPERGRVLDSHWMRARHEKVSRVAEFELGHDQVRGRWNKAVERALRADNRDELADRVASLAEGDRPREAFTAQRQQAAERAGLSLPEAKAAVADAWQRADGGRSFAVALAEHGLTVRRGERNCAWIVEGRDAEGGPVLVGAVHRLAGTKKGEAAAKLADLAAAPEAAPEMSEHRIDTVPEPQSTPPAAPVERSSSTTPTAAAEAVFPSPASVPAAAGAAPSSPSSMPSPTEATSSPVAGGGHRAPTVAAGGSAAVIDTTSTSTSTSDSDFVAPIDPTKPNDVQRFMKQMAAHFEKKDAELSKVAAAAARMARGGQHEQQHDDGEWVKKLIESWRTRFGGGRQFAHGSPEREEFQRGQRAIQNILGRIDRIRAAEAVVLERVEAHGDDRRDDSRRDDSRPAAASRQSGNDSDRVRGAPRDEADRRSDAAPGLAEAAGRQGEERTRPGRAAAGADRREPGSHRAEVGRRRIRARQAARNLAEAVGDWHERLAALSSALAPPEERIRAFVAETERRARQVLDTEPWKDPATRDAGRIGDDLDDATEERASAADRVAEAARAKAKEAGGRVGFFDRCARAIGIETDTSREAREAEEAAAAAEAERPGRSEVGEEKERNHSRARSTAARRREEHDHWHRRPDVQNAKRERHGAQLLQEALAGSDPGTMQIAKQQGPRAAMEQLLQEEERRRLEELKRTQELARKLAAKPGSSAPSVPSGPRMR